MRIRVGIDVNRPLRRKLKLRKNGGDWAWVTFKYERLYTFCYFCGCVGHSEKFCRKVIEVDTPPNELLYGPWLRAPLRRLTAPVGERWLVKEGPMDDTTIDSKAHNGENSGATTPKTTPGTPVNNGGVLLTNMEVDDEGLTVSKVKRRQEGHGRGDGYDTVNTASGLPPSGRLPASTAEQARQTL